MNHRCEGSLKAEVSIKYSTKYKLPVVGDTQAWRLFINKYDSDFDAYYPIHVSEIKFCPYCSKDLEKSEIQ